MDDVGSSLGGRIVAITTSTIVIIIIIIMAQKSLHGRDDDDDEDDGQSLPGLWLYFGWYYSGGAKGEFFTRISTNVIGGDGKTG